MSLFQYCFRILLHVHKFFVTCAFPVNETFNVAELIDCKCLRVIELFSYPDAYCGFATVMRRLMDCLSRQLFNDRPELSLGIKATQGSVAIKLAKVCPFPQLSNSGQLWIFCGVKIQILLKSFPKYSRVAWLKKGKCNKSS